MNVIESSHLETIKQFLEKNPDYVFKLRKFEGNWHAGFYDIHDDPWSALTVTTSSFVNTVSELSRHLATKPE